MSQRAVPPGPPAARAHVRPASRGVSGHGVLDAQRQGRASPERRARPASLGRADASGRTCSPSSAGGRDGNRSSDALAEVPAAMLVGGLGTRLRTSVPDRPKAVADVAGRPFLSYALDRLAEAGITRVVLCTGYRGEQIQQTFGATYATMRLRYSRESAPLGTAGALRHALPLLDAEVVLAMNGDALWKLDLEAFWQWHVRRNASASIVLARAADTSPTLRAGTAGGYHRYGRVQVDRLGRVQAFEEKSALRVGTTGGLGWINAGVYLLSRQVIAQIPAGRAVSIEREVFPRWVGRGLYGYRSRGRFLDIGTPESYRMAERFVRGAP